MTQCLLTTFFEIHFVLFFKASVLKSPQRLKKCGFVLFLIKLAEDNPVLVRDKGEIVIFEDASIFLPFPFPFLFPFSFPFPLSLSSCFLSHFLHPTSSSSLSLSPSLSTLLLFLSCSLFSSSPSSCLKFWRSFDQVWTSLWSSKQNWKHLLIHLSLIFGRSLNLIQYCTWTILYNIIDTLTWQWLKVCIPPTGCGQFFSSSYCAAYMQLPTF